MDFKVRRFVFANIDPLKLQLAKKEIYFDEVKPQVTQVDNWTPYKDDNNEEITF